MGIEDYFNTASDNNSTPPNGAPEGMAPSSVNDTIRQIMADIRTWYEDAEWVNWGHVPTRASDTSFTVATDLTAVYTTDRRVKFIGTTTGYGSITSSTYSSPNTTVNVTWDSGTTPTSPVSVSVGPDPTNSSIVISSSSVRGVVELATQAETEAKSSSTLAVTPAALATFASEIQVLYKPDDETINNSDALQADDDLTGYTLDADGYYSILGFLRFTGTVAADAQVAFVFTNAPQVFDVTTSGGSGSTPGTAIPFTFTSTEVYIHVHGCIRANASTGGTMELQWAQNSAEVSDLTLHEGSWIELRKIS